MLNQSIVIHPTWYSLLTRASMHVLRICCNCGFDCKIHVAESHSTSAASPWSYVPQIHDRYETMLKYCAQYLPPSQTLHFYPHKKKVWLIHQFIAYTSSRKLRSQLPYHTMGIIDNLKQKVSDHHSSANVDHSHNDGSNPNRPETKNWIEKGQGGDRSDDHGIRAGSLTNPDTLSSLSNPKVNDAIMKDTERAGSVSQ